MKHLVVSLSLLLITTAPFAANAETKNPNQLPTNLPGVTTIAAPPASFDALAASDEELSYWGFPPRPNPAASPEDYASWAKAIAASKTRIVPKLQATNIVHGPNRLTKESQSSESDTAESYNWSGYVDFSGAKKYGSTSFYYIISDTVVPVARQAFGACTGGWDYGSTWAGIDGDGSSDVLQAGFEFDAYCNGSTTATYYSPWYEWAPYAETRITNLPIAPGDDYFVEVWHTSATQGYAYLVNINTNQAVEVGFTAPSGYSLIGNSAEWITERPEVGGSLATLTNYITDFYWNAAAYNEKDKKTTPGSSTSKQIIMLDNNGKKISYPVKLTSSAFQVFDTGSAY